MDKYSLSRVLQLLSQHRPLLFFGALGVFLLLVGAAWGVKATVIYRRIHALALGYAMISVLLSIVGALALFTGIILHSVRGLLLDLVCVGGRAARPQFLSRALRFIGQRRPLLVFSAIGTLLLLAGVVVGIGVVHTYSKTALLAVGHTLLSVMLSILGSLSCLAGIILYSARGLFVDLLRPTKNADPEQPSSSRPEGPR